MTSALATVTSALPTLPPRPSTAAQLHAAELQAVRALLRAADVAVRCGRMSTTKKGRK